MFMDPVSLYHTRERANDLVHRAIFCAYWLYFYGFRGVLGGIRVLDYLGMYLVLFGLIWLVVTKRLNWRLVVWVITLTCPLFIAVVLDPSIYVILFVFKTYLVALYFTLYVKSLRLTIVEFVCFAVPVVVSVYFFLHPRPSDELDLLAGRMAGISEPNFTSLSLIYSMCGAFGIYVLSGMRRAKVAAIVTVLVCLIGVILTASRSGFIAATLALSLFLVIEKKMRYIGVIVVVPAVLIIAFNPGFVSQNEPLVIRRFQNAPENRSYLFERAWDEIYSNKWFIGGGPRRVSEWSKSNNISVPHNAPAGIGVAFGKGSFYFYSILIMALLALNTVVIAIRRISINERNKETLLASVCFLSLFPMYMFLSAGLGMDFILWMVLGAYPLLHASRKPPIVLGKNYIYPYTNVYHIPPVCHYDHL